MFIHNPTLCCQLAKKADYTHHAAARFIIVLPSDHMSSCGLRLLSGSSSGCRVFATTPPLLPSERAIMSQFLLFVITVLLIAVFWELCKINSQFKGRLPSTPQIPGGGQANDAETAKTFV